MSSLDSQEHGKRSSMETWGGITHKNMGKIDRSKDEGFG